VSIPLAREIAFDCRHFLGDRPCAAHKRTGALCRCDDYDRIEERVLLIKLDAMGDVLRTTSMLPALAEMSPGAAISWVTRPESRPLLERNPYVYEILDYGPDALLQLQARRFDRVINLDAGKTSAALAKVARAARKDGFVLDERGVVQPTNDAAREWLELGVFDDLKRRGRMTYQARMARILGLCDATCGYVFALTEAERERGRAHLARLGVDFLRPVVGLNTGAGGRWPLKQWREEGYLEVIGTLAARYDAQVVLLGGPAERERHRRLALRSPVPLIDAGCDNPVRHFAAIVGGCTLVVTGDTLALHIALALQRRVIVLFGPTSAAEIELYGLGEKVVPDMPCLSCYKTSCDLTPNCMDLIRADMVEAAIERQMAVAWPETVRTCDSFSTSAVSRGLAPAATTCTPTT
jgi:ADP-heptose:LPS heptosyltransferase